MNTEVYHLEFVMPCFCSGAIPEQAELRPSAIRGQLRWWFRALGGTFDEESKVFGRIGSIKETLGSAVVLRTRILGKPPVWIPPEFSQNDIESYVWYFAKVSGKTEADKEDKSPGPRWQQAGAFAPGMKWELRVVIRRSLEPSLQAKFDEALKCFLSIGSIGLRATRGLGAFDCSEVPFDEAAIRPILEKAGFAIESKGFAKNQDEAARMIGSLVKGTRKAKGWKNDSQGKTETPSPLGTSNAPRQTSAIWFRPVRVANADAGKGQNAVKNLQIVVFEAPHDKVLGEQSRKDVSVGSTPSQIVPYVKPVQRRHN